MSQDQTPPSPDHFFDSEPAQAREVVARIYRVAQALRRHFSPSRQVETQDIVGDAVILYRAKEIKTGTPRDPVHYIRRIMRNRLLNRANRRRTRTLDAGSIATLEAKPIPERSRRLQDILIELERSQDPKLGKALPIFKSYYELGLQRFSEGGTAMIEEFAGRTTLHKVAIRHHLSVPTAHRHVNLIENELRRRLATCASE